MKAFLIGMAMFIGLGASASATTLLEELDGASFEGIKTQQYFRNISYGQHFHLNQQIQYQTQHQQFCFLKEGIRISTVIKKDTVYAADGDFIKLTLTDQMITKYRGDGNFYERSYPNKTTEFKFNPNKPGHFWVNRNGKYGRGYCFQNGASVVCNYEWCEQATQNTDLFYNFRNHNQYPINNIGFGVLTFTPGPEGGVGQITRVEFDSNKSYHLDMRSKYSNDRFYDQENGASTYPVVVAHDQFSNNWRFGNGKIQSVNNHGDDEHGTYFNFHQYEQDQRQEIQQGFPTTIVGGQPGETVIIQDTSILPSANQLAPVVEAPNNN
jgi:hypothetical protein